MEPGDWWLRCADWAGVDLDRDVIGRLQRYRAWLTEEAIPAGGLGPDEGPDIDRRHIGDSILFAGVIDDVDHPGEIWDVGSGVGLPGIPLAIVLPWWNLHLLDRSGRRARLLRRATRLLGLENVQVIQGETGRLPGDLGTIVSRATFPPALAAEVLLPHLRHRGKVILGGSWVREPRHPGWETITIPGEILDHQVWLLMMRQT